MLTGVNVFLFNDKYEITLGLVTKRNFLLGKSIIKTDFGYMKGFAKFLLWTGLLILQ